MYRRATTHPTLPTLAFLWLLNAPFLFVCIATLFRRPFRFSFSALLGLAVPALVLAVAVRATNAYFRNKRLTGQKSARRSAV
jgi:hypothetical protein